MKSSEKGLVLFGLALGAVLGMAGTMVAGQHVRAVLWAIDGTGLIAATCVLAMAQFRRGNDLIAAGFLVYAIWEAVMTGGTALSLEGSEPASQRGQRCGAQRC